MNNATDDGRPRPGCLHEEHEPGDPVTALLGVLCLFGVLVLLALASVGVGAR